MNMRVPRLGCLCLEPALSFPKGGDFRHRPHTSHTDMPSWHL
jgi:hypothetical protein